MDPSQKSLYKLVVLETYRNLTAIGYIWEDHTLEEHFQSSRRHGRHERSCSGENPLSLFHVVKPLQIRVIPKGMKESMMERNAMNVTNVVKVLQEVVLSNIMKEHIQERKPVNVTNVVKPLQ